MGLHSQRILLEAANNGVIRSEESSLRRIPHSSLPVPKFAANVIPCSAPLTDPEVTTCDSSFEVVRGSPLDVLQDLDFPIFRFL